MTGKKDTRLFRYNILEAIKDLNEFTSNKTLEDLKENNLLQYAVYSKIKSIFLDIKAYPIKIHKEFEFLKLKEEYFVYKGDIDPETMFDIISNLGRLKTLVKNMQIYKLEKENPSKPLSQRVKYKTSNDILAFLKKHKSFLQNTYFVTKIGVFGSFSRDEPDSDSDIDILVSFDRRGKTFSNLIKLNSYLEENFKRKVDLITEEGIKRPVREKILNEVKFV